MSPCLRHKVLFLLLKTDFHVIEAMKDVESSILDSTEEIQFTKSLVILFYLSIYFF